MSGSLVQGLLVNLLVDEFALSPQANHRKARAQFFPCCRCVSATHLFLFEIAGGSNWPCSCDSGARNLP